MTGWSLPLSTMMIDSLAPPASPVLMFQLAGWMRSSAEESTLLRSCIDLLFLHVCVGISVWGHSYLVKNRSSRITNRAAVEVRSLQLWAQISANMCDWETISLKFLLFELVCAAILVRRLHWLPFIVESLIQTLTLAINSSRLTLTLTSP